MELTKNRRILVIDDNPSVQEDFRRVLEFHSQARSESLAAKEEILFGESDSVRIAEEFSVSAAYQGEQGLDMIVQSRRENSPYAVAFVDVRMPPGIDGIETIERIMPADPEIQLVICSAYSDYSARDIMNRLGVSDRLLLLRKPCDMGEIVLMAATLTEKWNLTRRVSHLSEPTMA